MALRTPYGQLRESVKLARRQIERPDARPPSPRLGLCTAIVTASGAIVCGSEGGVRMLGPLTTVGESAIIGLLWVLVMLGATLLGAVAAWQARSGERPALIRAAVLAVGIAALGVSVAVDELQPPLAGLFIVYASGTVAVVWLGLRAVPRGPLTATPQPGAEDAESAARDSATTGDEDAGDGVDSDNGSGGDEVGGAAQPTSGPAFNRRHYAPDDLRPARPKPPEPMPAEARVRVTTLAIMVAVFLFGGTQMMLGVRGPLRQVLASGEATPERAALALRLLDNDPARVIPLSERRAGFAWLVYMNDIPTDKLVAAAEHYKAFVALSPTPGVEWVAYQRALAAQHGSIADAPERTATAVRLFLDVARTRSENYAVDAPEEYGKAVRVVIERERWDLLATVWSAAAQHVRGAELGDWCREQIDAIAPAWGDALAKGRGPLDDVYAFALAAASDARSLEPPDRREGVLVWLAELLRDLRAAVFARAPPRVTVRGGPALGTGTAIAGVDAVVDWLLDGADDAAGVPAMPGSAAADDAPLAPDDADGAGSEHAAVPPPAGDPADEDD